MLIFPRVHFKREIFLNGAPPGTVGAAYPTGWMASDNFFGILRTFCTPKQWFKSYTCHTCDNYESHISIEGLDDASENGAHMLNFCGALLTQDAAIGLHRYYDPLKKRYHTACDNWMYNNPGKTMTIYDIASSRSPQSHDTK